MSCIVTTDTFCDDCSGWTEGIASTVIQRKEARKKAAQAGWHYIKSPITKKMVDVCPMCWHRYYQYHPDNKA